MPLHFASVAEGNEPQTGPDYFFYLKKYSFTSDFGGLGVLKNSNVNIHVHWAGDLGVGGVCGASVAEVMVRRGFVNGARKRHK